MATVSGQRIALVTGAASGIGRACAERLARDGCALAVLDRDAAMLADITIPGMMTMTADVTDESAVAGAFARIEAALGPVDILVTSAGIMANAPVPIAHMSVDAWEATFKVNTTGTFIAVREMLRRREAVPVADGRIVTISSAAAQLGGYRGDAAYVASKAAVLGLTKIAARQAAPSGLTVNTVAAGPVDTAMFQRAMPPEAVPGLLDKIPLGRVGAPGDVAGMVAFLATVEAGWITGATFDVNGGYRMQ
ncbi:SDR family oxidoreductase [Acuticoccus sp. M5D2P5]|uniref:SDR family NAD(P)-dependent oxidoreductase n=1 Tax=Acuticoccus kalidii TaxID=2910977 RepID=UPI001F45CEE1|nr:SDR family oxidoreductase [Acuticoccus kalidii]MCF3935490.1 SDR family oxidoreductase [Acuticoccus kalidii]